MALRITLAAVALAGAGVALAAADMLPIRRGIYAPVDMPCAQASQADIVVYHGDRGSIGSPQATCTIRQLDRSGNEFTIADECRDDRSGDLIEGEPQRLMVRSDTAFRIYETEYRWCRAAGG